MSETNLSFPETERVFASDTSAGSLLAILASMALFLVWLGWFVSPSRGGSGPSPAATVLERASGVSLR